MTNNALSSKIFSSLENEPKTVALLEKYKNEVSGESVLNINDNTLSININYNKRKNDHVWLIKKGNASQISFDFTDDEFSNIPSKNISIRMKLEDPEETYNLFEDVIEKKEK